MSLKVLLRAVSRIKYYEGPSKTKASQFYRHASYKIPTKVSLCLSRQTRVEVAEVLCLVQIVGSFSWLELRHFEDSWTGPGLRYEPSQNIVMYIELVQLGLRRKSYLIKG